MNIINYIILALCIWIAIGWSLKIREKAQNEQSREKVMELQGFLMTVSIILKFLLDFSSFHLLWLIPAAFVLGLLSLSTPLKLLWPISSIYYSLWYVGINNIGRKYYVNGEYHKAIECFKEDIIKKPSSKAYFNLGLAYGKIGQYDYEIDAYREAIKLNSKEPSLYLNLGNALNLIGKKNEAIETLNNAIILKSDYAKAYYLICKIYLELEDQSNTKKYFEKLKKLDLNFANEIEKEIITT